MAKSFGGSSLASWKVWWSSDLAAAIGKAIHSQLDVLKLPGNGMLLTKDAFTTYDLKDPYLAGLVEGMLTSYPKDRQPSAYLLGDSVLALDKLMNHSLLGPPLTNPIKERSRRDGALAEGGKLRKLLSFVRTSSLKHQVGKSPDLSYIKDLANDRVVRRKSVMSTGSSVSASASPSPFRAIADLSPECLGLLLFKFFWRNTYIYIYRQNWRLSYKKHSPPICCPVQLGSYNIEIFFIVHGEMQIVYSVNVCTVIP